MNCKKCDKPIMDHYIDHGYVPETVYIRSLRTRNACLSIGLELKTFNEIIEELSK